MKTSHLELDVVRHRTRVTRMASRAPLRFLETGRHESAVEIQMSSYGGGILQGDRVGIDVRCGDHAGLLLKSQANTHVYRNENGRQSMQVLQAECGAHARIVSVPDPVVLHAGANFRQEQVWNLSASTDLVLADWMQSGRSESNEQFAFTRFESHVLINIGDRAVLEETLVCRPGNDDIRSPALFGPYDLMLNIYILGPNAAARAEQLQPFLDIQEIHANTLPASRTSAWPPWLCALNPLPESIGYIFRAMAKTRRQLQPVLDAIGRP